MFNARFTKRSFSLTSLRVQLLLWVSLPAAVLLLAVSLTGVRGHEEAMQRLVQERADSLTQASAALIRLRLDHTSDTLRLFANDLVVTPGNSAEITLPIPDDAPNLAQFSAGLALYDQSDIVTTSTAARIWPDQVHVRTFIEQIRAGNGVTTLALYDNELQEWLLIQGVTVSTTPDRPAFVLLGAMPLASLKLSSLIQPLALSPTTEIHVEDGRGNILLDLVGDHDDRALSTHTKLVMAQAIIEEPNLHIVLRESWVELVPPVLRFGNVIFAVIGMAIVVSLLSVVLGLRGIVQPLQRLDQAADQVGWGHFDALEKPVGGVQEIEDLRLALKAMAGQIRHYQQELQSYISAMMLGQEEERKRLARELHDDTVQALIAVKQQVEIAGSRLAKDPAGAASRLDDLQPLLNATIAGIRRQIHDLRPLYIEDLGFVPAIEMLVKQTTKRQRLDSDFRVTGEPQRRLSTAAEISAYRIVQEALNNVIAHAGASQVQVVMTFEMEGVTVTIADDGCGLGAATLTYNLASQGHFGLLSMRERAQLCGGHLSINSAVGKGTTVNAWLPASL